MDVDDFIEYVSSLTARYEGRDVDYQDVGDDIRRASKDLPERVHPMITEIVWHAERLEESESYLTQDELRAYWQEIARLAEAYKSNQWPATVWILLATYLEKNQDNQTCVGYSISVTRHTGGVEMACSNPALYAGVQKVANSLNAQQTDEWFIKNLANALPQKIASLERQDIEVSERLATHKF